MLTNGQIIKGIVSEQEKGFLVAQRIGRTLFSGRQRAAGVFNSIREAYQYQVQQLPDLDCEERMKLARWCLNVKLHAEAREQLERILALNSKHSQARAMLFTMEQAATMAAHRQRDPEVQQTGAERTVERNPDALDSAVIQKAQRRLNITGMPVIFDLPTPLAILRTKDFIELVNPLLQAHCVKCHDANYDGEFQLVPTGNRAGRTQDALRLNLDATLRLVDRENPSKSELLTTMLRPHGPRKRPVFPGSNDKAYQVIAMWVQSLRSPKDNRELAGPQTERAGAENGETFAVGRARIGTDSAEAGVSALARDGLPPLGATPSGSRIPLPAPFVPRGGMNSQGPNPGAPDDFPLPFVLTGKKPNLPSPEGAASPASGPSAGAKTVQPGSPADAGKTGSQTKAGDPPAAAKKKGKPVTIDPALLERALQNRNGVR